MLIGIGFIKVGIILKAKLFDNKDPDNPLNRKVVNLTISASTWFARAFGVAIGFNFYFIAIITIAFAGIVPGIPQVVKNMRKLITKLDTDVVRVNKIC
jgi:putative Mg2+ transporter-C (MgtC) family protein